MDCLQELRDVQWAQLYLIYLPQLVFFFLSMETTKRVSGQLFPLPCPLWTMTGGHVGKLVNSRRVKEIMDLEIYITVRHLSRLAAGNECHLVTVRRGEPPGNQLCGAI